MYIYIYICVCVYVYMYFCRICVDTYDNVDCRICVDEKRVLSRLIACWVLYRKISPFRKQRAIVFRKKVILRKKRAFRWIIFVFPYLSVIVTR